MKQASGDKDFKTLNKIASKNKVTTCKALYQMNKVIDVRLNNPNPNQKPLRYTQHPNSSKPYPQQTAIQVRHFLKEITLLTNPNTLQQTASAMACQTSPLPRFDPLLTTHTGHLLN
jgi:hypothetical protein